MDQFDVIEINKAHQDIAAILRVYYQALINEGFTPEHAIRLTVARQTELTRPAADADA